MKRFPHNSYWIADHAGGQYRWEFLKTAIQDVMWSGCDPRESEIWMTEQSCSTWHRREYGPFRQKRVKRSSITRALRQIFGPDYVAEISYYVLRGTDE